jgi:hypothetical protein
VKLASVEYRILATLEDVGYEDCPMVVAIAHFDDFIHDTFKRDTGYVCDESLENGSRWRRYSHGREQTPHLRNVTATHYPESRTVCILLNVCE